MAEMILQRVGGQIGARISNSVFRSVGARLGRTVGRSLGQRIDAALFGEDTQIVGPRMQEIQLQGSSQGDPIPFVLGRVRLTGELFWAGPLREKKQRQISGGKGGGPSVERYRYSISLAIGVCEGEVSRLERAWANGKPLDLSAVAWRLHTGSETQEPDSHLEALMGGATTPAYRGLAYVVFEDFPLDGYGDSIPQFSFEVTRAPQSSATGGLESLATGVCLIPGAGEFALATTPVVRDGGPGRDLSENITVSADRGDLLTALDHLQQDLPNCQTAMIVTTWFGDDLRCGNCRIMPGVDRRAKATRPLSWRVQGITRAQAYLISETDGGPSFGGTPSDDAILEAIAALKARGFRVGLYPFIQMDIPASATLPDPYGWAKQPAFPWRGRITPHPARGQAGSVDRTAAASSQIAAFVGAAQPAHYALSNGEIAYSGPSEWSFRRFILHYAKLAAAAGGVDAFVMGSELRGMSTARGASDAFPFVDALKALAGDVRALIGPNAKLTYAADWSEYFGFQPPDGSGDVYFHLDALWADSNIDAVGVDWYPPLTDWRETGGPDSELAATIYDRTYLESRIEGGEGYDWYYANDAARDAQVRTPITDGAYQKPWVFRPKDIRNWWANRHYERRGGVELSTPTDWSPNSKPIWLVELGCPAIDKGANGPNLFDDGRSSESAAPPFSSRARDDLIQRRVLEAYLRYWANDWGRNPVSTIDGRRMVAIEDICLWAYDARPFPHFPALTQVWTDGPSWSRGHWLNGRVGTGDLAHFILELCGRAGVDSQFVDVSEVVGTALGCVLDAPFSAMSGLDPVLTAFGLDLVERAGRLVFLPRARTVDATVPKDRLIDPVRQRIGGAQAPDIVRLRYLDATRDYQFGVVLARRQGMGARTVAFDLPLAMDQAFAQAVADRILNELGAARDFIAASVPPSLLHIEAGDLVAIEGEANVWRVEARDLVGARFVRSVPMGAMPAAVALPALPALPAIANIDSTPVLEVFSLPPSPGDWQEDRPLAAVFAAPWRGPHPIFAGDASATAREAAVATAPAVMGELTAPLPPGPRGRWDKANRAVVRLYAGALESQPDLAVLSGENRFALLGEAGLFEVFQAASCVLESSGEWTLSGLLRGLQGEAPGAQPGARIVKLDQSLARLDLTEDQRRAQLTFAAPRFGRPMGTSGAGMLVRTVDDIWARPLAPEHVRGQRAGNGDVTLSWIRCARLGGDTWDAVDVPLGEAAEAYSIEILNEIGASVRSVEVSQPVLVYPANAQIADFGALPAHLKVRVKQKSQRYGYGLVRESILWL
jgi:hypothetical protein